MSALLGKLRDALGEASVVTHEPVEIDAHKLDTTLVPEDGPALGRALASLSAHDGAAIVRGAGTHLHWANRATRADCLLSTEGLKGIVELDAEDGVVHVQSGTPLEWVRTQAAEVGWELPLDPPGMERGASVGGVLSAGLFGPRRLGFGPPRDTVLGLEIALSGGERIRCGGRVVKNVTGYDLQKLFTGAFGSLGVIEAAWLRLRAVPESVLVRVSELADHDAAFELALAAARRPCARVSTLLSPRPAERAGSGCMIERGFVLVVEFAGDASATAADADWLARRSGALGTEADGELVDAIRRLEGEPAEGGVRARLALPPAALPEALSSLAAVDADLIAHPGLGIASVESRGRVTDTVDALDRLAAKSGADLAFEWLPAPLRSGRDVFGLRPSLRPLTLALKNRFDPKGVLNPGRFAGGV